MRREGSVTLAPRTNSSTRGLADAGLTRDKDQLTFALQSAVEALPQRRQLALPANESGRGQAGGCRRLRLRVTYGSDKAVSAPGQGFDERGLPGGIAECATDVGDLIFQNFRLDVGGRPDGFQQLILGDQPPGAFDQIS